jgi:hypothetical protein
MKKKILAVLSLVMVLAMESVTVFAAETENPSINSTVVDGALNNIPEQLLTRPTTNQVLGFTVSGAIGDENVTGSVKNDEVAIVADVSGNSDVVKFNDLTEEVNTLINDKVNDIVENATKDGITITNAVAFDVEPVSSSDSSIKGTFIIAWGDIKAGDKVIVYHYNGTKWEEVQANTFDGMIQIVTGSYSPFIVVKYDDQSAVTGSVANANTSYTVAPNNGTISGAVSPKTANADPYAVIVAIVALACGLVCTRKLAKN